MHFLYRAKCVVLMVRIEHWHLFCICIGIHRDPFYSDPDSPISSENGQVSKAPEFRLSSGSSFSLWCGSASGFPYQKVEKLIVIEIFILVFFQSSPPVDGRRGEHSVFSSSEEISREEEPPIPPPRYNVCIIAWWPAEIPLPGYGSRFSNAPYWECNAASFS